MQDLQFFKYKKEIPWLLGAFLAAGLMFLFTAYGRFPVEIRTLAATVRYSFVSTSIFILVIFYLILRLPGRWRMVMAFAAGAALFGLALGGLWASGQSEPYVVSGLIPYNDAATYSIDANRLLDGVRLSAASARRPLPTGFLGAILGLTARNLQQASAVLVFLLAISSVYLALEVRRAYGATAGAITIWIVFLFARRFAGTTMTEVLGLSIGALGLAFLLKGAFRKSLPNILAGLFLLTLALNIRAGAFFLLPVLILWTGWLFRNGKRIAWKPAGLALLVMTAGFLVNTLVFRLIGAPGSQLFSNFAESLYGLAAGGERWSFVYGQNPETLLMSESGKAGRIYQLAFDLFRSNPMGLVNGMLYQWGLLFSESWFSVYSYVGGENALVNQGYHLTLYVLCSFALINAVRKWNSPVNSLLLFSIFGIFLSVPFVPPGDAHKMRAFAATIPILAFLPAAGAAWLVSLVPLKLLHENDDHPIRVTGLNGFSIILVAFMVIAPVIALKSAVPPVNSPLICNQDEQPITMYYADGNAVRLIREEVLQLDWLPEFHYGRYKIFIHNLPNNEAIDILSKVEPPATMLLGYDIPTGKKIWLLAGTDQMPGTYGVINVCGKYFESNDPDILRYGFYYPRQIQLVQ